jgi:hypothetical protein
MMQRIRNFVNKSPWAGWAVAFFVLGVAVWMFVRGGKTDDPYDPERMQEIVHIRFSDTNEEITMPRGQLDKMLRRRGENVSAAEGIINPKTGAATGFPYNKDDWDGMIARINAEKEAVRKTAGTAVQPALRKEPAKDVIEKVMEQSGGGTSAQKPASGSGSGSGSGSAPGSTPGPK